MKLRSNQVWISCVLMLLDGAGCTSAPARTGGPAATQAAPAAAPANPAEPVAAPANPTPAPAPAAPRVVEGVGASGEAVPTGEAVLSPPDGKWLTDEEGNQYFIWEVPRLEGQYIWEDEHTVRLRGGMPLKLARYDDKTFYAKIFRVAPGEGSPVRDKKPGPADLEKAAASYRFELPVVDRVSLAPFDAGLPRTGQWRNGFDVADMNGDGLLDIVHGPSRKGTSRPAIFLGDGKGTWRLWTEVRFPDTVRYDYGDVAAADLNGDGKMDLVVAMHVLGLRAFLGDGKGGFSTLWSEGLDYRVPQEGDAPPGFSSRAIRIVDWNGDKQPDVLALGEGMYLNVNRGDQKVDVAPGSSFGAAVYLNGGKGTWERKDKGTDTSQLFGDTLGLGDFDGDGRTDFVTSASFVNRDDLIHLGRGETWETARLNLRPRGFVTAVAAGDFDGDGTSDAAVAYSNSELGVLRSGVDVFLTRPAEKGGLTWERQGLIAIDGRNGFYALAAGDVDGDKALDLVVVAGDGQVHVFLGNGKGAFARLALPAGVALEQGCRGYDAHLVDFDKDGRDEIVVNFAGEPGSMDMIRALGPDAVKKACPSEGSIRAWKAVRNSS